MILLLNIYVLSLISVSMNCLALVRLMQVVCDYSSICFSLSKFKSQLSLNLNYNCNQLITIITYYNPLTYRNLIKSISLSLTISITYNNT